MTKKQLIAQNSKYFELLLRAHLVLVAEENGPPKTTFNKDMLMMELNDIVRDSEQRIKIFEPLPPDNYHKCKECDKMLMNGVQCKDPRTGKCDIEDKYLLK